MFVIYCILSRIKWLLLFYKINKSFVKKKELKCVGVYSFNEGNIFENIINFVSVRNCGI